jgi:hypothetical protein
MEPRRLAAQSDSGESGTDARLAQLDEFFTSLLIGY